MSKSNFIVRGGADFSGIQREMAKTQKQFQGFSGSLTKGLKSFSKAALLTFATKKLYDFGKASIKVASDLEEIQNVTNVTFGSMADDIDKFSRTLIDSHGIGELSAKKYASYMGAMLKSSGIHGESVKEISMDITKLTADMASFYNLDTEEMFQKIMSGMTGATMPLKKLGINMNIANLQAFALSQGINKSWQEMSQAEQTMVRYNYLMSVTGDSQGDFARNADNWAHSLKILGEKWKELMGLVGRGLNVVLLPLLQILIKIVDFLIMVAEAIGRIYTMITGKELSVKTNKNIGDTAFDAAEGEEKLADGIGKAAKAAQKALAPFDELNLLQNEMGSGGGGGGSGIGGLGDFNTTTEINTIGESMADGFKKAEKEASKFMLWISDKWQGLRDAFKIPIYVPAPIFEMIPMPIYQPNWGLTPPLVESPVFEPIPNPIYEPNWNLKVPKVAKPVFQPIPDRIYKPNWGLDLPPIEQPIFPAIEHTAYDESLSRIRETHGDISTDIETENVGIRERISIGIEETLRSIEGRYQTHRGAIATITEGMSNELETEKTRLSEKIRLGIESQLANIEENYNTHKENVGLITTAISEVMEGNIAKGLTAVGLGVIEMILSTQGNLQIWGINVGGISAETAKAFAANKLEGLNAVAKSTISFANDNLNSLRSWAGGVLSVAAEGARGFASNWASGFSTTWDNFRSLMSSMGEKVSGWWSENKSMVFKTAVVGGAIIGAGALALTMPAAIPYAAAALGGLSAVPALAKGGITNGPMLAMIGDNPGGKEVVSPLDKLQDMLISAVGTALIQSEQFNSSNGEPIITQVFLEGREIAKAVYDPLEEEKARRGNNPIIQPI